MKISQRKKFGLPTAAQGQLRRVDAVSDVSAPPPIASELSRRSNNGPGQLRTHALQQRSRRLNGSNSCRSNLRHHLFVMSILAPITSYDVLDRVAARVALASLQRAEFDWRGQWVALMANEISIDLDQNWIKTDNAALIYQDCIGVFRVLANLM